MKRNKNCKRCILHESANHPCVWGTGDPKAKLFLCGESPGMKEDIQGKPFVGQAGQLLNHILNKLSLKREDLYITNCLKCHPPKNILPKKKELLECWEKCQGYFGQEIRDIYPKVVLLMGNTSLTLVSGLSFIGRHEGSKLDVGEGFLCNKAPLHKFKVFASYHPAAALRAPKLEKNIGTAIYVAASAAGLKPKPKGMEVGCYDGYEVRS